MMHMLVPVLPLQFWLTAPLLFHPLVHWQGYVALCWEVIEASTQVSYVRIRSSWLVFGSTAVLQPVLANIKPCPSNVHDHES